MKRLLKRWVFWLFVAPLVVLPFYCTWRTEEVGYSCRCGSGRIEENFRFDAFNREVYRGSPRVVRRIESELWRQVLQGVHVHVEDHEHQIFTQADGTKFSAACPRDSGMTFDDLCRSTPGFLAWLKAQVGSGKLTPQAVENEVSKDNFYPEGMLPFGWTPP